MDSPKVDGSSGCRWTLIASGIASGQGNFDGLKCQYDRYANDIVLDCPVSTDGGYVGGQYSWNRLLFSRSNILVRVIRSSFVFADKQLSFSNPCEGRLAGICCRVNGARTQLGSEYLFELCSSTSYIALYKLLLDYYPSITYDGSGERSHTQSCPFEM